MVYELILHTADVSGHYRDWIKNAKEEEVRRGLMQMAVDYTARCGNAEILDVCSTKQQAFELYERLYSHWTFSSIHEPGTWPGNGYGLHISAIGIWETEYKEDPNDGHLDIIQSELVAEYVQIPNISTEGKKMANNNKIFSRDIAARILESFEETLDEYNITVPSPEDDEREPDNPAKLYGSTYYDLLDDVESIVLNYLKRASEGQEIVEGEFSGMA